MYIKDVAVVDVEADVGLVDTATVILCGCLQCHNLGNAAKFANAVFVST